MDNQINADTTFNKSNTIVSMKMSGKIFVLILFLILTIFTISLFYYMYMLGWFDKFISGGFSELYPK